MTGRGKLPYQPSQKFGFKRSCVLVPDRGVVEYPDYALVRVSLPIGRGRPTVTGRGKLPYQPSQKFGFERSCVLVPDRGVLEYPDYALR